MGPGPPDPRLRRQPALRHGSLEPRGPRGGAPSALRRPDARTAQAEHLRPDPLLPPPARLPLSPAVGQPISGVSGAWLEIADTSRGVGAEDDEELGSSPARAAVAAVGPAANASGPIEWPTAARRAVERSPTFQRGTSRA